MNSSALPRVDLAGFGHCCADYLALLQPFPEKGKKGDVTRSLVVGGGPVPTACQTIARFGRSARFVGKVGDDADGELVRRGLTEEGVDAAGMLVDPAVTTARAYIWIDPADGSRTVALDVSNYRFPSEREFNERLAASCAIFLVDGRAADATIRGLKVAQTSGAVTVLDAGAVRPRMREMLALIDYAIVSSDFADTFAPGAPPDRLAAALVKAGAGVGVVTAGEKGAYFDGKEGAGFIPAVQIGRIVDSTGAGDVFHGGFIFGLLEGWVIERRIRFAGAAAALSTQKLSGRFGIPSLKEVDDLLAVL